MSELTFAEVDRLLAYDGGTGLLTWKHRSIDDFQSQATAARWNTRYAGAVAGCRNSQGYLVLSIRDKRYLVHRVCWLLSTGSWPERQLDHIDHQRTNNRRSNLREASHAENGKNQRRRANQTGSSGVTKRKDTGKWQARIRSEGRTHNLGCFATEAQAIQARELAKAELGFHPNHGK